MTIVLADDHYLILDSLKSLLKKEYPAATILLAPNKETLFQFLQTQKVDILVQDIKFGNDHANNFINELKKQFKSLKILILSSISDSTTIRFFSNKTDGYILKTEPISVILLAIKALENNETYFSPESKKKLIDLRYENYIPLTNREIDVLKLIMKERSNRQIAETLNISDKTVEMHRANIYLKLDVSNLTGLVKKVISLDILEGH